jgi:ketosteroid isomerase-like protein
MNTPRRVVPALFLLGALTACQPAPADLSDKDVTDIKAMVDRWVGDFATNKRDDVASIITADMVLLPPNTAPLVGHDAAMGYLKAYPPITKFTATKDEVVGHGDLAYVRGSYSIDVTLPDKSAMHEDGTYIDIHRKQKDGTWPYSRLIWHSSNPMPAPAPAKKKK